jgi:hypothetical protein
MPKYAVPHGYAIYERRQVVPQEKFVRFDHLKFNIHVAFKL